MQFIFHQSEVITEQNETDTIRLIRGFDLIASDAQSARTYYHYASDELGSTTHIVDEKGKVLNRYAYDAFGNITEQEETVPNCFKFNGQQFDPITQQYYLRARFYNPVAARFTQEDVYRGDGLNLYAYCHNNPVVYEDPSGYDCISGQDLIAGQRDGQLALPAPDPQLALPKPGETARDIAYKQLREQGYTAAEAYYLSTGTNPLNAAGTEAMGRYEAQKIMDVYQAATTTEYINNVLNPSANGHNLKPGQTTPTPQQLGSWTHADVAAYMQGYLTDPSINVPIATVQQSGMAFVPTQANPGLSSMPYIQAVAIELNMNQGNAYTSAQPGGARPDIAIFYGSTGTSVHVGDIKTGTSVRGSTYSVRQQGKNETHISGNAPGYMFTHETVNP